jgi:hypothetical protein
LLALHVNQLIDNLQQAYVSYESATAEIQDAIAIWNNKGKALIPETALRVYKYDLLEEYLVREIRQAFVEILLVADIKKSVMSRF